jgi:hypothetical protein
MGKAHIPNDCYVMKCKLLEMWDLVILAVFGLTQLSEEMSILLKLVNIQDGAVHCTYKTSNYHRE